MKQSTLIITVLALTIMGEGCIKKSGLHGKMESGVEANFFLDQFEAKPLSQDGNNLAQGKSDVSVYFKFCIADSLFPHLKLAQVPFQITLRPSTELKASKAITLKESTQDIEVAADDCAYFTQQMKVDALMIGGWAAFDLEVKGLVGHYKNQSRVRRLYLNFLNPQSANFLWDGLRGAPPVNQEQHLMMADLGPQLLVREVKYALAENKFQIGDYLDLSVNRKYLIRLKLLVDTGSADRGMEPELGDNPQRYIEPVSGQYRLQSFVAVTDKNGKVMLVSADLRGERQVSVINGSIQTDLQLGFGFDQLPLINGRSTLYLMMSPIDTKAPTHAVFSIPFYPGLSQTQESWTLDDQYSSTTSKDLALELIEQTKNQAQLKNAPFNFDRYQEQIRKSHQLGSLSSEELAKVKWNADLKNTLLEGRASLSLQKQVFCSILYPQAKVERNYLRSASNHDHCMADPKFYYSFELFQVASRVTEYRQESNSYNTINTAATIMKEWRVANVNTVGGRAFTRVLGYGDYSAGVKVAGSGWSKGVRVEGGVEGFYMTDHSWGENTRNRRQLNSLKNFDVDHYEFSVHALTHQCAVVYRKIGKKEGFLLCQDAQEGQLRWLRENWYYLQQNLTMRSGGSVFRDTLNVDEMTYSMAIRGSQGFNQLRETLEDSTRTIVLDVYRDSLAPVDQEIQADFERYFRGAKYPLSTLPGLHFTEI